VGLRKDLLRRIRRSLGRVIGATIRGSATIASRIPDPLALRIADALALVLYLVNSRGRAAGHENLKAVYGDSVSARERRRILRGSYRTIMRSAWSLIHLRPLPEERYRRFVTITPELEERLRRMAGEGKRGVMVSGHLGNYELLAATRAVLPYSPRIAYIVEQTPVRELDDALDELRSRGIGSAAFRKGGALALSRALSRGDCIGIAIDRNVRGEHGGIYVPFLGLPARTTPLPVMLARRYGVGLSLLLCVPDGQDHWRLYFGPDLMEPPTDDEDADILRVLTKVNDEISRVIREHPESWLWMLKRWKSRPTPELGPYPAYSLYDPDP
jgi:Kdo2-lipid IVA lauroyltransferase/acyltransferase